MEVKKIAFFIEDATSPEHSPLYFASDEKGSYWTDNIFEAMRFVTKTMATGMLSYMGTSKVRIVEHILTEGVDYEVIDTGDGEDPRPEHVLSAVPPEQIIAAAREVA